MSDGAKVLSRGTVLVDPRAAIAKLREWQLAEPVLYVLEVVRVAVMGGATAVELYNDSDDLVLTFDGDAPPAESLARLLDFLFSSADRRMRLLAIAVNTALGFAPHFVDLYTTRHEGLAKDSVARVRWLPRDPAKPDEEGLDQGAVTVVPRPEGMPDAGVRVHVHEAFGMAVMREWFKSDPAETQVLRERALSLTIPIRRDGKALEVVALPRAVAEVPLEGVKGATGHLALVDERHGMNQLVLCEHGVVLERRTLEAIGFGEGAPPLPVRVLVDAPDLPTNASRSQVNLAEGFGAALRRAWVASMVALVDRVVGAPWDAATTDALFGLVLHAYGNLWIEAARQSRDRDASDGTEVLGTVPRPALERIFDAPLVPKATGGTTSLRALAKGEARYVWQGDEPVAPELAPWLGDVVWARKETPRLTTLLQLLWLKSGAEAIAEAREAHQRYQKFMAHARRPASVARSASDVLRVRFGTPSEDGAPSVQVPAEGVAGEVVLHAKRFRQGTVVRVTSFYDGRPVSSEALLSSAVAMEAAIEGPSVRPKPAFDGVVRDEALERALTAVRLAFAEGVGVLCAWKEGTLRSDDSRGQWVGDAAGDLRDDDLALLAHTAWVEAIRAEGRGSRKREVAASLYERFPALRKVAVWPTSEEAGSVSTEAVVESANRPPRVVCVATAKRGARKDGRPVLVLDGTERDALEAVVPVDAKWVDCTKFLPTRQTRDLRDLLTADDGMEALPWWGARKGHARVAAAPSPSSRGTVTYAHSGQVLETRAESGALATTVAVVEDDALLPSVKGANILPGTLSADAEALLRGAGAGLLDLLLRCLEGDREARAGVSFPFNEAAERAVQRFLLTSLRKLPPDAPESFASRIQRVPLVPVFAAPGELRPLSVEALRERFESERNIPLPTLREVPHDVDAEGFEPLIFPAKDIETLFRDATNIDTILVNNELPKRRTERIRRLALEALKRRPKARLDALDMLGAAGAVAQTTVAGAGSIAIGLPDLSKDRALQVLVENVVALADVKVREDLPVVARVTLDTAKHLTASLEGLTQEGERALERLVEAGALALALRLAEDATKRREAPGDAARAFLTAWVNGRGRKRMLELGASVDEIVAAPLWRTPWGAPV